MPEEQITNTQEATATAEAPATTETSTVVEAKPEVAVVGKKKQKTGNLLSDIASEVETFTKTKALAEADRLSEDIEVNCFKLGGVLKLINDNSWFEGYPQFDNFVLDKYGFAGRKARYLISIYDNLVTKMIPWEKVSKVGWTKLKELAPVLTPENVDEWVAKAMALSTLELQAVLKSGTEGKGETNAKTTDEVVKVTFKFKTDQAEIVNTAISKAKGILKTDFDTVALENICAGYVGGTTSGAATKSFEDIVGEIGFEAAMTRVSVMYPEYDINVSAATHAETATA